MSASDPLDQLNDEMDLWTYVWGNGIFSSQKIYVVNFMHIEVPDYIWKKLLQDTQILCNLLVDIVKACHGQKRL